MKFRFVVPFIFLSFSLLFFRQYFFQKKVPLPFNLLVSFYSPWKYESKYGVNIPNKPLGDDNIKLFYPYRKFTIEELKKGRIPLWNPYTFSGSVNHAMYQSAVFYPLNIVYLFLPLVDAWSVIVMITPVLTGWFMYLFLRSLGLRRGSSFFGALVFAVSGWMMAFWEEVIVKGHTILWLPLALYGVNKKKMFVVVIALVNAILAGFPQMIVYLFITLGLWGWYQKKKGFVMSGIFMALLLTAFQWIPAFEAFLKAPRGKVDTFSLFETYLTPLTHLVTFLAPDFWGNPGTYNNFSPFRYLQEHTIFIGIPAILFALSALLTRSVSMFWKVFSLITLSMGFALPTSWILYTLKIPILNIAMPVRIFVLATFGLSTLAAYGIEKHSPKNNKFPILLISSVFILLWFFVGLMIFISKYSTDKIVMNYATVSLRNLVLPTVIFVLTVLCFKSKRAYLVIFMSFLTLVGAYFFGNKILYFSERGYEYPLVEPIRKLQELAGYDRVWSYGDGYIVRNISSFFDLYSAEGYEALYSHRYGTLLHTIVTRGILTDRIQRTDATLSETGQYEIMTNNPVRVRLMSLLGVKYILEHKDTDADRVKRFPPDLFKLAWENEGWRIWEYNQALPRTFLVSQGIVESDPQKIIDKLLDLKTDLRKTVVVETKEAALSSDTQGIASITEYQPSSVTISTKTTGPALLFLSDSYYPGWRAFVDSVETPIYRANFVFRAVKVPEGAHTVRFLYDPLSWKLGLMVSGIGLVVTTFLVLLGKRSTGHLS